MTNRVQAAAHYGIPIFHDGSATFQINDTQSGKSLCVHRFLQPDHKNPAAEAYIAAERAVAVALADALNAAGSQAIDRLVAAKQAVKDEFFPQSAA